MDGLLPAKGQPMISDLGDFDDFIEETNEAFSSKACSIAPRMHLA
jgi:hypothetical protein